MVKDILMLAKDSKIIQVRDHATGRIIRRQSFVEVVCNDDMEAFSHLDDSILDVIRLSPEDTDEMAKASLLVQRLQTRDLYTMAGNLCIQDGKTDECFAKHREMWNQEESIICNEIVHYARGQTHTMPEEEVPETDGEEEDEVIHSSQMALIESEKDRRKSKSKKDMLELLPCDLRIKKFTVGTGGGGSSKFADPVQHVWFYNNDASEYEGHEMGLTLPHKVSAEHYKCAMPANFCIRELKVLPSSPLLLPMQCFAICQRDLAFTVLVCEFCKCVLYQCFFVAFIMCV